jgi:hypothetical protein
VFSNFWHKIFGPTSIPDPGNGIPAPGHPTTSGKVVAITLEPHTIATIFGAIQDTSIIEHVAVVELHDKGMTVEKTVTFDGKKENPYHIVGEHDKFTVTWGPFPEQKKIQVALYWSDAAGNGLDPIDTVKELSDDKNRTKVTLLSVHHRDQNNLNLRTVVNITCMKVKG